MKMVSLPTIPDPEIVITGGEECPNQIKDDFFASILSFLEYDENKAVHFTRREDRVLSVFDPVSPMQTNDWITMLIVQDVLVASVVYRRNDFNYVCVSYAHYLTERVIERTRWHERKEEE